MLSKNSRFHVLAPLFFILVIDGLGGGLIFPILAPLFVSHDSTMLPASASVGLRNTLYGLSIGMFFIAAFFAAPLLGDFSDRLGRKKVLIFCLLGTAISFFLSAFAITTGSVSLLLFGRFLGGLAAGSQGIAQAAIIDISGKDDKALNLSYMVLASCIGFVLGPLIGGIFSSHNIVSWFSFDTPFYLAAIMALVNLGLLWFTFTETHTPDINTKLHFMRAFTNIIEGFRKVDMRMAMIIFFIMQFAWGVYFQFVSLFLAEAFEYTAQQVGFFMAFLSLIFIFSLSVGIRLVLKYLSLNQAIFLSFGLMSCGALAAVFIHTQLAQWLCTVPIGIGVAIGYTTTLTLMSNCLSESHQGLAMGLGESLGSFSWFLAGTVIGFLSITFIGLPFIVVVSLLIVNMVLMTLCTKKYFT